MEENVVKYYVFCNKLKNIIRKGWKDWNVKRDRLESVAEHIYGVQMLAIAMYSQYKYDLDLNKILLMLAIHELEEIVIGDLTCFDISENERQELGHKAVEKVLDSLYIKDELKKIILEFDERKTKEAIFAYHCDKLEWDIQSKLYDEEHCVNMDDQQNNKVYYNEKVQNLINSGNTSFSDVCIEFDRSKFIDDPNFIKVIEYVKKNKIR